MGTQKFEETAGAKVRSTMRWDCAPALIVLLAVVIFWVGGSLQWFALLKIPENAVGNVVWLYFILVAVAGSVVLGGGAAFDLARRVGRHTHFDD
ncbi:hypothetical protein GCM10027404_21870 [Arthrobacter tumbae]|uniref:hypothetical protein n=1 Tax=Arthrobacter tumbae TaxID=163874 RepID=UPI001957DF96|nr:hypothetical protein [Arthrobacter tumbae]MBM7781872.1 hypothetical protein [Arthrobacter tumbae]